jgi:hypothetical protein
MRTILITFAAGLLASAAIASASPLEDTVKASLLQQSQLAYGVILADGVPAGRLYSREATASGARRHAEEFIARQYVPLPKTTSAK